MGEWLVDVSTAMAVLALIPQMLQLLYALANKVLFLIRCIPYLVEDCTNTKNMHSWVISGPRSYFVPKLMCRFTTKKREELITVIRYHEGYISFNDAKEKLREIKDDYANQSFSTENWAFATIAGWIDSDGSIGIQKLSQ